MALTYDIRGKDDRTPVEIVVIVRTVVIPEEVEDLEEVSNMEEKKIT